MVLGRRTRCRAWSPSPPSPAIAASLGVAVDQEIYASAGGEPTASWEWDYPGNTHEEAEVRAQVARTGRGR